MDNDTLVKEIEDEIKDKQVVENAGRFFRISEHLDELEDSEDDE